jgi:hypothetical protein
MSYVMDKIVDIYARSNIFVTLDIPNNLYSP